MQYKNNSLSVTSNFSIKKCLELINDSGENTLLVVDKKKKLIGTLSDGDIRRAILKNFDLKNNIKKYYHKKPYKIFKELNKSEILDILIKKQISIIPLVDNENKIKNEKKIELLDLGSVNLKDGITLTARFYDNVVGMFSVNIFEDSSYIGEFKICQT